MNEKKVKFNSLGGMHAFQLTVGSIVYVLVKILIVRIQNTALFINFENKGTLNARAGRYESCICIDGCQFTQRRARTSASRGGLIQYGGGGERERKERCLNFESSERKLPVSVRCWPLLNVNYLYFAAFHITYFTILF